MKWYKITEKNPSNKSLVAIWYHYNHHQPIDSRYDPTVYNSYKLAFYEDGKWLDLEDFETNLANKHRIYKWYEVPFEHGGKLDEKIELDPIGDRFEILDL